MASITLTIDNDKVSRYKAWLEWYLPQPKIVDPDWVLDEKKPTPPVMIYEFTENEWLKEGLRRYIRDQIKRYETKVAKDAANVAADDAMIT